MKASLIPRYTLLYTFLAVVLGFLMTNAAHSEISIDGVPLPQDAKPLSAEASQSPFAGTWVGMWDNAIKTILIVESVDEDGNAKVIYAVGSNAAFRIEKSWTRYSATLSDDVLTVYGRNTITYRFSKSGRLRAVYGDGFGFAVLSRQDLASLKNKEPPVSWSAGESTYLLTNLIEADKPVNLEAVIYKPAGTGPFPLAVINHGSTGNGKGDVPFTLTWKHDWLAEFLTDRGFLVAFPQRRGRGKSDGLYDEGFAEDRANGYTCEAKVALKGAERAISDLGAVIKSLKQRPDVKDTTVLLAGQSRGGILSVAYAGVRPDQVSGVVNFVGGWLGGCDTAEEVNQTLFKKGADFPKTTLWIYGDDDLFYTLDHSRKNFEAFKEAGGKGEFVERTVRGKNNGHWVMAVPPLWEDAVNQYIAGIKN